MNKLKVLIIGFVWPEPDSSAAGLRMMQLIRMFLTEGYEITFASTALESEYTVNLYSLGVEMEKIKLNSLSFDLFIRRVNPQIVVFDRFMIEEQFGWRVALHCPNALRVLDTEDLHSLRISREKASKANKVFEVNDLLKDDTAMREIASILRSDISLIVSKYEMHLLKSVFKIDKSLLYHIPLFVNFNDEIQGKWKCFEEKSNFMFIGNLLHEPNWDAVQFLKSEVWPLIRKRLPKAVLKIYGAYPTQKVFQLHNERDGFLIIGRADNSEEVFMDAKVILAPLRFGAGIKGKLLEAMQYGTPSITTSIGAESINEDFEWNGFIANTAEIFADKAVELYLNEEKWNKARINGIKIIESKFLCEIHKDKFIRHILNTYENVQEHRTNNFLGSLLHHHTLRSTEYMSRWIEEKNKK